MHLMTSYTTHRVDSADMPTVDHPLNGHIRATSTVLAPPYRDGDRILFLGSSEYVVELDSHSVSYCMYCRWVQ